MSECKNQSKNHICAKRCWICYVIAAAVVLGMKLFYSRADSDALQWILVPTAWWVRILSGTGFVYEAHIGYVNHAIRFIIAPSCSSIQFMTVLFAVLVVSFVRRMGTAKKKCCWLAGSAVAAVLLTIFVNGFRIVLSIYLPGVVFGAGAPDALSASGAWLTPERLHTMTGVAVYFTSLIVIYCVADRVSGQIAGNVPEKTSKSTRWILPVLIYFFIVLILPLLNGALKNNRERFSEYAVLVVIACLLILCFFRSMTCLKKKIKTCQNLSQEKNQNLDIPPILRYSDYK